MPNRRPQAALGEKAQVSPSREGWITADAMMLHLLLLRQVTACCIWREGKDASTRTRGSISQMLGLRYSTRLVNRSLPVLAVPTSRPCARASATAACAPPSDTCTP